MSAHEIEIELHGKGLDKYSNTDLVKIINTGLERPWLDEYYVENSYEYFRDRLYFTAESKEQNLKQTIENIKQFMPEVEEMIWHVKPYYVSNEDDECGLDKHDFAYWTRNEEFKKAIWDEDSDLKWDGLRATPECGFINGIYYEFKDEADKNVDIEDAEIIDVGYETEYKVVESFFEMLRNHNKIDGWEWVTRQIDNTNV